MMDNNHKNLNRRLAFRIYEEANLFYQKIDSLPSGTPSAGFDGMLRAAAPAEKSENGLPDSQIRERDTMNVNISSSGIAFTCRDQLKAGDHLLLRIILLSSMTVLMTCCKVVYSKASNPHETDCYPYFVGAQFVNLTQADRALLARHISRRRKQRWMANGFLATLVLIVLYEPGLITDWVLGLAELLLEMFWESVDTARDFVAYWLERALIHIIPSSHRLVEIVGFYLQAAIEFAVIVLLVRGISLWFKRLRRRLRRLLLRKKASLAYYWREQTALGKLKLIALLLAVVGGYGLFLV